MLHARNVILIEVVSAKNVVGLEKLHMKDVEEVVHVIHVEVLEKSIVLVVADLAEFTLQTKCPRNVSHVGGPEQDLYPTKMANLIRGYVLSALVMAKSQKQFKEKCSIWHAAALVESTVQNVKVMVTAQDAMVVEKFIVQNVEDLPYANFVAVMAPKRVQPVGGVEK